MRNSLRFFNKLADALRVGFAVAVAGERIAAAGGFNEDVRPDHAGLDVHGRDFGDGHADLVLAEPRRLAADDGAVVDFDDGAEEMIATRPPAGFENFRRHGGSIVQSHAAATGF